MAKTDLNIPSLGDKFIDLRDSLPGDAYTWSWERPLSQINYLAIHHTGVENQTPSQIANSHITANGWGGIGYHFLIDKQGFVYYTGDISTARANVANLNEQVLGICLIGNFVSGEVPSQEQLDSTHKLCEFLISYSELSNVKSWDKVRGHTELPNQSTPCPGDNWPSWRIQIVEGVSLVFNTPSPNSKSQVDSLQTSLAYVNQQVFTLQEALQEKDKEIMELKKSQPEIARPKDATLTIVGALINLYKFLIPPGKEM